MLLTHLVLGHLTVSLLRKRLIIRVLEMTGVSFTQRALLYCCLISSCWDTCVCGSMLKARADHAVVTFGKVDLR